MCWKCGKSFDTQQSVFKSTVCPYCGADMHCCKNCKYYSPGNHYDCRETVEELVKEKETSNFCSYFEVKAVFSRKKDSIAKQNAEDIFNSLFN